MNDVASTDFKIDLSDERLWRGDQLVRISNKAFQLLRLFVRHPNRLLTKDVIFEEVWPDVYVSEGLIKEYVHDLRLALEDDPKLPRFIETVRGRGYRFLGGIEVVVPSAGVVTLATSSAGPPSLAVRPFANLSGAERWSLFCGGLVDDLMTDLARYPDLTIVADSESTIDSTNDELHSGYVINGSVQASDSSVRVNVRLIETRGGKHIWSETYDREIGEFFEIQDDIVASVASAVGGFSGRIPHVERLRLGRRPPEDLHAYELYLLSCELEDRFDRQSAFRGIELLQRAVKLDPEFARAWLVLGWMYWQIAVEGWASDARQYLELVREAYTKAATLDPLDPFAVMELAAVRAIDADVTGASDALERALDLGKNRADLLIAASTYVATVLDLPARAMQLMDNGMRLLTRVSKWHHMTGARVAYFATEFDRAASDARLGPDNLATRLFELLSVAQLGRRDAIDDLARAFEARYPEFDPETFMSIHPVTAGGAKRLFLEGIEKAGLDRVRGRRRSIQGMSR